MAQFLAVFEFPNLGPGHPEDNERERLAFEDALKRAYSSFPHPDRIKVLCFKVTEGGKTPNVYREALHRLVMATSSRKVAPGGYQAFEVALAEAWKLLGKH